MMDISSEEVTSSSNVVEDDMENMFSTSCEISTTHDAVWHHALMTSRTDPRSDVMSAAVTPPPPSHIMNHISTDKNQTRYGSPRGEEEFPEFLVIPRDHVPLVDERTKHAPHHTQAFCVMHHFPSCLVNYDENEDFFLLAENCVEDAFRPISPPPSSPLASSPGFSLKPRRRASPDPANHDNGFLFSRDGDQRGKTAAVTGDDHNQNRIHRPIPHLVRVGGLHNSQRSGWAPCTTNFPKLPSL